MTDTPPKTVLVLCLGNICRSPIAEGLLRYHAIQANLDIEVDSAGTSAYHAGEAPDSRSIHVMKQYGHNIQSQRSRQLRQADFEHFDLIFAMDKSNLKNAQKLAQSMEQKRKVVLFLSHEREVPDPYYGGPNGFENVYQMIDLAAKTWVKNWKESKS